MNKPQCSPAWKTGTIVTHAQHDRRRPRGLNVVRPGRPEQFRMCILIAIEQLGLNVVRPGRPEQSGTRRRRRLRDFSLNVVRPGRPEQYHFTVPRLASQKRSQCSPAWKTGTMRLMHSRPQALSD